MNFKSFSSLISTVFIMLMVPWFLLRHYISITLLILQCIGFSFILISLLKLDSIFLGQRICIFFLLINFNALTRRKRTKGVINITDCRQGRGKITIIEKTGVFRGKSKICSCMGCRIAVPLYPHKRAGIKENS